jgi:hypothetical protein
MRTYLLVLITLWPAFAVGQITGDTCQCTQVLQQVSHKASLNYAGWDDKVTTTTKTAYSRLLDSLLTQAGKTTTDTGCFTLLKAYKAFFRDGHVQVSLRSTAQVAPRQIRRMPLTETQAQQWLKDPTKSHHPLEGIWETPEHSYKLAILADPQRVDSLVGIVLSATNTQWTPGLVKLRLAAQVGTQFPAHYRNAAFEDEPVQVTQTGNLFQISGYGYWQRLYPQRVSRAEQQALAQRLSPIEFRQVSPQVAYLRVSSFNVAKAQVDSLVRVNQPALRRTPTLIIDIRDNTGGSNSSFAALLPLMNTNNFQDMHTYMRTSPDNIAAEEALVAQARAGQWDTDSVLNSWAADVAQAKAHPNQLYRSPGGTIRLDSVRLNPARVALLMNQRCYSSAEYFVFYAKQSRKVTLFGQHTGGVMDYGNVRSQGLDCPRFGLRLPTTRSGWVDTSPIDNVGFQPDIPIPATEPDWINYVVRYYNRPSRNLPHR